MQIQPQIKPSLLSRSSHNAERKRARRRKERYLGQSGRDYERKSNLEGEDYQVGKKERKGSSEWRDSTKTPGRKNVKKLQGLPVGSSHIAQGGQLGALCPPRGVG